MQDNGFKCEPAKKGKSHDDVIADLVNNDNYILQLVINLNKEVEELKNRSILGRLKKFLISNNLWIKK